jgi:hypothetical protein
VRAIIDGSKSRAATRTKLRRKKTAAASPDGLRKQKVPPSMSGSQAGQSWRARAGARRRVQPSNAPGARIVPVKKGGRSRPLSLARRRRLAARLEGLLDPNDRPASPKPGGVQRQRGYVQQGLAERRLLGLFPLREISWHNATVALCMNSFHSGRGAPVP